MIRPEFLFRKKKSNNMARIPDVIAAHRMRSGCLFYVATAWFWEGSSFVGRFIALNSSSQEHLKIAQLSFLRQLSKLEKLTEYFPYESEFSTCLPKNHLNWKSFLIKKGKTVWLKSQIERNIVKKALFEACSVSASFWFSLIWCIFDKDWVFLLKLFDQSSCPNNFHSNI